MPLGVLASWLEILLPGFPLALAVGLTFAAPVASRAQPALQTPPAPATSSAPTTSGPDAAEALRQWMLAAPGASSRVNASLAGSPEIAASPWVDYLRVSLIASPVEREGASRRLLKRDLPDDLRRLILWDMKTDLAYRGREAEFIRRYGFYANWFNRFAYAASRAMQGNIQAAGQLVVDAFFDALGDDATPGERRLYDLLLKLREEGQKEVVDAREMKKLQARVDAALADVDIERGHWALERGEPEIALFYARGARTFSPESKPAAELTRQAESKLAEGRRGAIASAQMGYPNRRPPITAGPPEAARAALVGPPPGAAPTPIPGAAADDAFYAEIIRGLAASPRPAESMEAWSRRLADLEASGAGSTWMARALNDPRFNPEVRLDRARGDLRGRQARYVLAGPEKAKGQAYKASSRFAQMWSAVPSIGIFYGMEVAIRSVALGFRPATPNDEARDAAADFLRQAPQSPRAPEVSAWLEKLRANALKLEKAQVDADPSATRILTADATGGAGPAATAKNADAKPAKPPKAAKKEKIKLETDWKTLAQWAGTPAPCGLPGDGAWFDGNGENGEIESPRVQFEALGADADEVAMTYFVKRGGEREVVGEKLRLTGEGAAPARVVQWLRLGLDQRRRVERDLRRLDRSPIPYEVVGGIGGSGVDFYPRLLPLDSGADMTLYKD